MIKKVIIFGILFLFTSHTFAQNLPETSLDYKDNLVTDMDLDGLTDLGEKEIFKTDPINPDSDNDGFYDGAEVLNKTDPLNNTSPSAIKTVNENVSVIEKEAPWAWYIARVTGLISFLLLYIVMFLGLAIRTPFLNKTLKPIYSLNTHAWLSVQALILVFIHGGALLFDNYASFDVPDVLTPFFNKTYGTELALGIVTMYLMLVLILSSYLRKFINYKVWRITHFLNIPLFVMAVYHGLYMGTDLADGFLRQIYIYANLFLVFVIIVNILSRIVKVFAVRNQEI